jgi:hypothetical protein
MKQNAIQEAAQANAEDDPSSAGPVLSGDHGYLTQKGRDQLAPAIDEKRTVMLG